MENRSPWLLLARYRLLRLKLLIVIRLNPDQVMLCVDLHASLAIAMLRVNSRVSTPITSPSRNVAINPN